MKRVLNQVALFKKIDGILQACIFIILIFTSLIEAQYYVYCICAMAAVQVISCITWSLFFTGDTPRFSAGTVIRRLFLIILLLGVTSLIFPGYFFYFLIAMLYLGPICGLAYFIITLFEINFYQKAWKPYYLL